ncbi:hypothetical protein PMZ80_003664 [Knufia obscura]|uniref:Uncharacterized protein n=1 Tax=Knufia obscura TaxID=1635080 RepID=A0ABR0RUV3_9EURO|nr:hypothetical protein PMZ80_003664 [Knufia obscura]
MYPSLSFIATIALLLVAVANAQSIFFTQYPTQVINGQSYPVSWEAGGVPVTLDLIQGGELEETLFSGAGTTFTWNVDGEGDGGTDYALRITPQGNGAAPLTSGTIWVIEDEDGLEVNGQEITASIPNGPTPSGLDSVAASPSGAATGTAVGSPSATATNPADTVTATAATVTGPRTEIVTFSSAQSIYTFTTTVSPSGTVLTPTTDETLTFISGGLTFTTTISAATATSTATTSATPGVPGDGGGGGLSGGAIAGIVIGVLIIVLLVLAFLWFRRRRQRQRAHPDGVTPESPITTFIKGGRRALKDEDEKTAQRQSLVSPLPQNTPGELHSGPTPVGAQHTSPNLTSSEIDGSTRHEMNAMPPTYELAAGDPPANWPRSTQYPAACVPVSKAGIASDTAPASVAESGSATTR